MPRVSTDQKTGLDPKPVEVNGNMTKVALSQWIFLELLGIWHIKVDSGMKCILSAPAFQETVSPSVISGSGHNYPCVHQLPNGLL